MWLPSWAAKIYAQLYARHRTSPFLLQDLRRLTGLRAAQARNVLSLLRRRGFLILFGREGRKRVYRLLEPSTVVYLRGWGVVGYESLPGPYVPLLLSFLQALLQERGRDLRSVVLYGSVARGDAKRESDIDLLLVVRDLPDGYMARVSGMTGPEGQRAVQEEKALLRRAGYSGHLSWIVVSPEEARRFRLLYLDISTDGHVLLDREGLFEGILEGVRKEMNRVGATSHPVGEGWYWSFGKDIRLGARVA